MPKVIRQTLLSLRDMAVAAGPFVLLAFALLAGAYWVLQPAPPKRVVLATGLAQGAYAEFGARYATFLRQHGITVELALYSCVLFYVTCIALTWWYYSRRHAPMPC